MAKRSGSSNNFIPGYTAPPPPPPQEWNVTAPRTQDAPPPPQQWYDPIAKEVRDVSEKGGQYVPPPDEKKEEPTPPPVTTPPVRRVMGTRTKRQLGGVVQTIRMWDDGTEEVIDSRVDKSAGESARDIFRTAGLDDNFVNGLMSVIDNVYNENIDPTAAQVLSAIYNSEPYKKRFPANELIRKRIADGVGRPGDRLLSPKEYMELEQTYRQIFRDSDMPEGYYDEASDFTNFISNDLSPLEVRERVNIAKDALYFADQNVVSALQDYYGLTTGDLTAYLLDPERALTAIQTRNDRAMMRSMSGPQEVGNNLTDLRKTYQASQVGGMGRRAGIDIRKGLAEEIIGGGMSPDDNTQRAISAAADLTPDYTRLGELYSETTSSEDLIREALDLTGGVEMGQRRRKLASQERAQFAKESALGSTSLRRVRDV